MDHHDKVTMKAEAANLKRYDEFVATLYSTAEQTRVKDGRHARISALYYELLAKYYERIRIAKGAGRPVAACCVMLPATQVLHAMDVVPMHLETGLSTLVTGLRNHVEAFDIARAYGLTDEICPIHRIVKAVFLKGWVPDPDLVLWGGVICDNIPKTGEFIKKQLGIPGFFVDLPYRGTEEGIRYVAQEIGDAIHFLEDNLHRAMNWQKLKESLRITWETIELQREVYRLRATEPSPLSSRLAAQAHLVSWAHLGSSEGLLFWKMLRDEVKKSAERRQGAVPNERLRLLSLCPPPYHTWKLLDWMEKEYGAITVANPVCEHWGEWQPDYDRPLESLARLIYATPDMRLCQGPLDNALLSEYVQDGKERGVDGALFWAYAGCRQTCAMTIPVEHYLKQAGVPVFVADCDAMDPNYVSLL